MAFLKLLPKNPSMLYSEITMLAEAYKDTGLPQEGHLAIDQNIYAQDPFTQLMGALQTQLPDIHTQIIGQGKKRFQLLLEKATDAEAEAVILRITASLIAQKIEAVRHDPKQQSAAVQAIFNRALQSTLDEQNPKAHLDLHTEVIQQCWLNGIRGAFQANLFRVTGDSARKIANTIAETMSVIPDWFVYIGGINGEDTKYSLNGDNLSKTNSAPTYVAWKQKQASHP